MKFISAARKSSSLAGGNLEGNPTADGWLDREENIHVNYTQKSKVELSGSVGSEVGRSGYSGVG